MQLARGQAADQWPVGVVDQVPGVGERFDGGLERVGCDQHVDVAGRSLLGGRVQGGGRGRTLHDEPRRPGGREHTDEMPEIAADPRVVDAVCQRDGGELPDLGGVEPVEAVDLAVDRSATRARS